jgi:hypothetical protein
VSPAPGAKAISSNLLQQKLTVRRMHFHLGAGVTDMPGKAQIRSGA